MSKTIEFIIIGYSWYTQKIIGFMIIEYISKKFLYFCIEQYSNECYDKVIVVYMNILMRYSYLHNYQIFNIQIDDHDRSDRNRIISQKVQVY